jgi:hypothetical protein
MFGSLQSLAQGSSSSPALLQDVVLERNLARTNFSMGTEFMNLTGKGGSIAGLGARLGFEYGLFEKISIGSDVSFSFQATGKPGAFFYTGIKGYMKYAWEGFNAKESLILKRRDGVVLMRTSPAATRRSTAILGLDQLFLNGAANIYPAVGITIGASRVFDIWKEGVEIDFRYSSLMANDNPLTMINIGASINLDL